MFDSSAIARAIHELAAWQYDDGQIDGGTACSSCCGRSKRMPGVMG
jgi:hypothetical protein